MRTKEHRPTQVIEPTHAFVCGVKIARVPQPLWGAEVRRRIAAKKKKIADKK